jgi:hypothetical protein
MPVSEISLHVRTTRCFIPDNGNIYEYCCEDVRSLNSHVVCYSVNSDTVDKQENVIISNNVPAKCSDYG